MQQHVWDSGSDWDVEQAKPLSSLWDLSLPLELEALFNPILLAEGSLLPHFMVAFAVNVGCYCFSNSGPLHQPPGSTLSPVSGRAGFFMANTESAIGYGHAGVQTF